MIRLWIFASGDDAFVLVMSETEEGAREFLRGNGYCSAEGMALVSECGAFEGGAYRIEAHCSDRGPYIDLLGVP